MTVLSKLRAIWYQRRAETIVRRVESQTRPLFDLAAAVIKAALACAEVLKPEVNREQDPERWMYVYFEFVYFFMHVVNRSAFEVLEKERRTHLQNDLAPLVVKGIVEALFDNWPEKYQRGIERSFYEKLDITELEYATCEGLFSKENPITGNSLISALARNGAELVGKPLDLIVMTGIIDAVTAELRASNLDKLVNAAGAAIRTA